jgi:hypothetical protein
MFDRITYEALWKLSREHPESGVSKMPVVEYYGRSLRDAGMIRDGQDEIWFKNVVHDVHTLFKGHSLK